VRHLYLLRHAKSSWGDPGLDDHDRPLAPRGRRAAKQVRRHMRGAGIEPELALCSSARRTQETLERLRLGGAVSVSVEDGLYAASADRLLERLREVPDEVGSVLVIAHNPGLQALAASLASGGGELPRLERQFPTAALATLAFEGPWRDLGPGGAELVEYVVPRELP